MIARTWRARAARDTAAAYQQHFADFVAPQLKTLAGHRGASLLRREVEGEVEFVALTLWDSRDSIRAFAGEDIGKAHVEPAGRAALSRFDDFAEHYELVVGGD